MSIVSEINRIKTNISNAYATLEEKGATIPENKNSENLSTTIESVSSGGDVEQFKEVESKDINFYDAEGNIVYSYTLEEIQQLNELPSVPKLDEKTLEGDGWTHSLQELKQSNTLVNVGSFYRPKDGKTHVFINLNDPINLSPRLGLRNEKMNTTVNIDWGDGSEIETIVHQKVPSFVNYVTHNYTQCGKYEIIIESDEIVTLIGSTAAGSQLLISESSNTGGHKKYQYKVEKIYVGDKLKLSECAVTFLDNLKLVTIQKNTVLDSINILYVNTNLLFFNLYNATDTVGSKTYIAYGCKNLKNIIMPQTINSISAQMFYNCINLRRIALPDSVETVSGSAFSDLTRLEEINTEKLQSCSASNMFNGCSRLKYAQVTELKTYTYRNCSMMIKVTIPSDATIIPSYCFNGCSLLNEIKFPNNIQSIEANSISNCVSCKLIDFRDALSVPTLANTSAFSSTLNVANSKIVVPDNLYDEWIAANNWSSSSIKPYIIKASDYND